MSRHMKTARVAFRKKIGSKWSMKKLVAAVKNSGRRELNAY